MTIIEMDVRLRWIERRQRAITKRYGHYGAMTNSEYKALDVESREIYRARAAAESVFDGFEEFESNRV